jgi:hypothetical protein
MPRRVEGVPPAFTQFVSAGVTFNAPAAVALRGCVCVLLRVRLGGASTMLRVNVTAAAGAPIGARHVP